MLAQLYLAYEERLKTILDPTTGKPFFKSFDLWNNDVLYLEQTNFEPPALFLEFEPIHWRTMGQQVQDADLTIRLHIVTTDYGQTKASTPAEIRQSMLDYLNIPALVVKALQGFCTPFTNGLMRTQSIVNHDHLKYVDSIEEYICRVVDSSAQKTYATIKTPELMING